MQAVVVEFRIKREHVEGFATAIADNARTSRETEPGCRQFDVCRDAADPALFFLYELYDDEAAFQAHLRTAHFVAMDLTTAAWVEAKSIRKLRRTSP
jgi:(4S)-4-hydroxy-5-phosphonooxypentane-2,3-dione isomerase